MTDLFETGHALPGLAGRLRALASVPDLQRSWLELEKNSNCTFFQSWHWMGTWLESFADRQNMYVFECHRGDVLIGLGVLGKGRVRRRLFFTSRQLVLNESADAGRNMLVEHNELLARSGEMGAVIAELFRVLDTLDDWEEFKVAFGNRESWALPRAVQDDMTSIVDWVHPSWVVPLDSGTTVDSLLAGLSTNRRYQMRRTIKEFAKRGLLSIAVAGDVAEALAYFRALGNLHTERWRLKGEKGCFSRTEWVQFHEALIRCGFPNGTVQLLRIRCGEEDIGYIYNLMWRGSVLMLQTGFLHSSNNLLRAGYISHLLAMELNARRGMSAYDFMPGNDEYKRVLARPGPAVASVRFQRHSIKFRVERLAVEAVRKIRGWRERLRPMKSYLEAIACLVVMLPDRALEVASQIEALAAFVPLQ